MIKPIEYFPDGVRVTLSGLITSQDILDANNEILKNPNFPSYKFSIWVYEAVEDIDYDKGQIKALAESD